MFSDNLKLYVFKDKYSVDLSIRVSDNYVQTFPFKLGDFNDMITMWRDGYNNDGTLFRHIKRKNLVRLSMFRYGVNHHFRFTVEEIEWLEQEFEYQLTNKMDWDK